MILYMYSRLKIADLILSRIQNELSAIKKQWLFDSKIPYFVVDNLLPDSFANQIYSLFPSQDSMDINSSLREHKFVSAQMNAHNPVIEEVLFSFQDPRLVALMGDITCFKNLEPDNDLYAGGVSLMANGHFLNPHLDNSHDKNHGRYRVLNLLYYVSPNWSFKNGGNLELWPEGPKKKGIVIENKFNRLVVMATNENSWHSVSMVTGNNQRCCISNYYFSKSPPGNKQFSHVTSFRGRPEQRIRDIYLRFDSALRGAIRKVFPSGLIKTKHFYKKDK